MLYLEDYLEMIEHIPQDMRERLTEMREMDLQVQNTTDVLEAQKNALFANGAAMRPDLLESDYQSISQEYYKALEIADEKVNLASSMYDQMDRYLRRLDTELHKFKMELEADNAGITEILERRSQEQELTSRVIPPHKIEKRRQIVVPSASLEKKLPSEKMSSLVNGAMQDVMKSRGIGSNHHVSASLPNQTGYSSSSALAQAASQAIAATQQMQLGRRTATLKASFPNVSSQLTGMQPRSEVIPQLLTLTPPIQEQTTASLPSASVMLSSAPSLSRTSRKKMRSQPQSIAPSPREPSPVPMEDSPNVATLSEEAVSSYEWAYDPNEPRYCICNEVSYGEMVACDNRECPYEWFHYNCVGITQPPKGRWYCPQCNTMKRKNRK